MSNKQNDIFLEGLMEAEEARKQRMERLSRIFGWKYFRKAKPFKRFQGEVGILVGSYFNDQIKAFQKENEGLKNLLQ